MGHGGVAIVVARPVWFRSRARLGRAGRDSPPCLSDSTDASRAIASFVPLAQTVSTEHTTSTLSRVKFTAISL